MTGVFDGIGAALSDIFGGAVTYQPAAGVPRSIVSIFRRDPITINDADGRDVLITAPTWRVRRDLAPEVRRGDTIQTTDGGTWRVLSVQASGSPGADAFVICELEIVTP